MRLNTPAFVITFAVWLTAAAAGYGQSAPFGGGLNASHLLLLTNRNVPESLELARFYSNARGVAADRILELDLPTTTEISAEQYEREVVPAIRGFLRTAGLEEVVRCIVPVYGMPLRIKPVERTEADRGELSVCRSLADDALKQARARIEDAEELVAQLDPAFRPDPAASPEQRMEALLQRAGAVAQRRPDAETALAIIRPVWESLTPVVGLPMRVQRAKVEERLPGLRPRNPDTDPATTARQLEQDLALVQQELNKLGERRWDPEARKRMRQIAQEKLGYLTTAQVAAAHANYMETDESTAALDSELALLWWPWYSRGRWAPNPLNVRHAQAGLPGARTLMTCRLDGPSPAVVRDGIILASLKAEKAGLAGRVVIDRGGAKRLDPERTKGGYWEFEDSQLVALTDLLARRTRLELYVDTRAEVLAPLSVLDASVYVGWYSVRAYVPGMRFVPGAVGYHVASLEMIDLRAEQESGWAKGLLRDGIAATVGAVAEPYLHAFPPPAEFFPLLLTGQHTLAETYWMTVTGTSWMMCLVGDPLYKPFAARPALAVKHLPESLTGGTTRPATGPAAGR